MTLDITIVMGSGKDIKLRMNKPDWDGYEKKLRSITATLVAIPADQEWIQINPTQIGYIRVRTAT